MTCRPARLLKYSADYQGWLPNHKKWHNKLVSFLLDFKKQLSNVYEDKSKTDNEKYALKNKLFEQLSENYTQFKIQNNLDCYD
jgi:predicted aminopeptidase